MTKRALLLYDATELVFKEELIPLRDGLRGKGFRTFLRPYRTAAQTIREVDVLCRKTSYNDMLLVVWNGHGNAPGWKGEKTYAPLSKSIARAQGKVLIVNDTCYGNHFAKHLARRCNPSHVGFIANWDSEGLSYPNAVRDSIEAWSQQKRIEDIIGKSYHCTDEGEFEVPIQLRWGAELDSHFFFNAGP